ncbi:pantoate--beta-alanine ligase [Desulfallas thermosapovorans]|uniref:Pantothenate synthetase n=1 Tax=Desulfallas thermosapovorans DSM 6562 TaxID=1121431 RepID=A0A5S4ZPA5_9FIRM|nr:pantoate--beta-alanine ligase [Desulfallas thermosapovorans]TYO94610.1 pantoate--beta-alanine ligase [Desulfallas thermosapovorans DSM 6562]
MQVCRTINEIREFTDRARTVRKTVGLVPTMGYFHEGHLNLMREAKKICDCVVVSLYVNPLQFGPREDLAEYPRDFERDCALAESVGVDAIFAPDDDEMYPAGYNSYVEVSGITDKLCGLSRPGHFRGVTTVVTKLFNIVRPDQAFFGQKDAQQAMVIEKMVRDLNMNLEIITLPIVREADGLAMSSRNVYLSEEQRRAAPVLYRSLCAFKAAVDSGERDVAKLRRGIEEMILSAPGAQIDYIEILSVPDLETVNTLTGKCIAALAVRFGKTRLIDNMVVEV